MIKKKERIYNTDYRNEKILVAAVIKNQMHIALKKSTFFIHPSET